MLDSAQLLPLLPQGTTSLIDLGSGAGFPGLVLAILGIPEVHLIESDQRKCVFLAEAARAAGAKPIIHNKRIEQLEGLSAGVVTARACAPLDQLLTYAQRFLWQDGKALFLKGAAVEEELAAACKNWQMEVERFPSTSDPTGCILRTRAGSACKAVTATSAWHPAIAGCWRWPTRRAASARRRRR